MLEGVQQELEQHPVVQGITIIDAMEYPGALGAIIKAMIRSGPMTESMLASTLGLTGEDTRRLGELLTAKGLLTMRATPPDDEPIYQVRFAEPRKRKLPEGLQGLIDDD